MKYFHKALKIFQQLNDFEDIASCRGIIGWFYSNQSNYQEAIFQFEKAIEIADKVIKNTSYQADFYESMGAAYYNRATNKSAKRTAIDNSTRENYLKLASENLGKSIIIARLNNYKQSEIKSLEQLTSVETSQGRFADALKTYKEYIVARDDLNNAEKDKEYTRHELSFEYTRRKDSLTYVEKLQKQELAQIKELSANKLTQRSLFAVVVMVILLLIVSFFFFRNRIQQVRFKGKMAKEKSELELKQAGFENRLNDLTLASLKSQMNPHFIFNCLNSIRFYVEKNDTAAASLYITKFSKLIRNILDSARSEKITLAEEIELNVLYLEMEHMRLKEKLKYKLDIAKDIDIDFIEIPPLLIQPYVENAIWHGLMPKENGGTLIIKMFTDDRHLIITVTDNGIGREKATALKQKNNFKYTSHGSNLNSERIAMFNSKYKTNTKISIADLKTDAGDASGTMVTIKLLIQ